MSEPTHIIMKYASNKAELIFRASDGVGIGQRKEAVVIFGECPNKRDSRVFVDEEHAERFLREKVAKDDLVQSLSPGSPAVVVIEERNAESTIILPEGVMELPGGARRFN